MQLSARQTTRSDTIFYFLQRLVSDNLLLAQPSYERRESVKVLVSGECRAVCAEEGIHARLAVSYKVAHLHGPSTTSLAGKPRDGESHELSGEIGQTKQVVFLGQWKVLKQG